MKKNILLSMLLVSVTIPCQSWPICAAQQQEQCVHESSSVVQEDTEFDDFFGEPDLTASSPRKKKKKWSKLKILMIKLGVIVALRTQSFYQWLSSVWLYLTSWMHNEQVSGQA